LIYHQSGFAPLQELYQDCAQKLLFISHSSGKTSGQAAKKPNTEQAEGEIRQRKAPAAEKNLVENFT
jgi:hypothetical protein